MKVPDAKANLICLIHFLRAGSGICPVPARQAGLNAAAQGGHGSNNGAAIASPSYS
jgi:hypothetical protein